MSVIPISTLEFIEVSLLSITMMVMISFLVNIYIGTRKSKVMNSYATAHILMIGFIFIMVYTKLIKSEHYKLLDYLIAIIITFMSYFFVLFAYEYFSEKNLSIKKMIVWGLVPFIALIALGINFFIVNLFNEPMISITNFVVALCFVVLIIRGSIYLFKYRSHAKRLFKMRQSIYFSFTLVTPILCLTMAFTYMADLSTMILSILLLIAVITFFVWGIWSKMLDEMPSLMNHVINNMQNGIIIINENMRIIDYNKSVIKYMPEIKDIWHMDDFLKNLYPIASHKSQIKEIEEAIRSESEGIFIGEIELLIQNALMLFSYHVGKVRDHKEQVIATMLVIHDITPLQALYQAIEDKNKQMKMANQQLENHVQNVNELYVEEERKRLYDDINDTLGHSMTEVLALLEVSLLMLNKGQDQAKMQQVMDDSIARAKQALVEIRASVKRYKQETEGEL